MDIKSVGYTDSSLAMRADGTLPDENSKIDQQIAKHRGSCKAEERSQFGAKFDIQLADSNFKLYHVGINEIFLLQVTLFHILLPIKGGGKCPIERRTWQVS